MDNAKVQQIQQQFQNNRQAAFKALVEKPSEFVAGQADALQIPYEAAARLVAYGVAHGIRDISLQVLAKEAQAEAAAEK